MIDITNIKEKILEEQNKLNQVYNERDRLVALISSIYPSHLAIDEGSEEGFKYVVYIQTPEGQLSWHIADEELVLFGHLKVKDNDWDGHTTEEKYDRIQHLINFNTKSKELHSGYITVDWDEFLAKLEKQEQEKNN